MDVNMWSFVFFFFNDTATTEIYTLSLHDALPIYPADHFPQMGHTSFEGFAVRGIDRKSTRLNSSHQIISYAVFCLKKKIQARYKFAAVLPALLRLVLVRSLRL